MKRIKHAAAGMFAGWAVLQMAVVWTALVGVGIGWIRQGMHSADLRFAVWFLALFAAYSAVVCLVTWLLVYLPVYWYWPRSSESWGKALFTYLGALSGGMMGVACIALKGPCQPLPVAFSIIAMPTVAGGVSALVGYWLEDKERRFLEWQKQVTNPILE